MHSQARESSYLLMNYASHRSSFSPTPMQRAPFTEFLCNSRLDGLKIAISFIKLSSQRRDTRLTGLERRSTFGRQVRSLIHSHGVI